MNIAYFKDRDSLYFEFSPEDPAHAWEAQEGVVINLSADGRVVGIEIERASEQTNLDLLRVGDFPGEVVAVDGVAVWAPPPALRAIERLLNVSVPCAQIEKPSPAPVFGAYG